jgi:hypothetical protein
VAGKGESCLRLCPNVFLRENVGSSPRFEVQSRPNSGDLRETGGIPANFFMQNLPCAQDNVYLFPDPHDMSRLCFDRAKKKKDVNAFETEQLLGFATLRRMPSIVKNLHNTELIEVAAANEISFARWPVAYRLLALEDETTTSWKD